jgi:hypothetical protein
VIPQITGKFYWILKRAMPSIFYGVISYAMKKGYGEEAGSLFATHRHDVNVHPEMSISHKVINHFIFSSTAVMK